ncbi:MAG: type II toxin-antitoxin system RelE family toxin [Bacillota bacterium]|jgi:hypothetical protein
MSSNENLTYEVKLLAQPRNYLKRVDRATQKRIAAAIEAISVDPLSGQILSSYGALIRSTGVALATYGLFMTL